MQTKFKDDGQLIDNLVKLAIKKHRLSTSFGTCVHRLNE
jgi:hypothetical protein